MSLRPKLGSRVQFTILIPHTAKEKKFAEESGIVINSTIQKIGTVVDCQHKNLWGARRKVYSIKTDDGLVYELENWYIDKYVDKGDENLAQTDTRVKEQLR